MTKCIMSFQAEIGKNGKQRIRKNGKSGGYDFKG